MKKYFVLSLIICLFLSSNFYSQWSWQNFKPQGNNLHSVYFISENDGWITGSFGTILKTTDGGTNWKVIYTDSSAQLKSIFFVNEKLGYTAGDHGLIYKTTNGGNSWEIKNYDETLYLETIYFVSETNGWAGGQRSPGFSDSTLYKTTDGGESWIKVNDVSDFVPKSFHFFDENNGWIIGSAGIGNIYETNNKGISWHIKHIDDYITEITVPASRNVVVEAANFGFFRRTSDGGKNWENRTITYNNNEIHFRSAFFISESVGWLSAWVDAYPYASVIYKTSDGGKTLQVVNTQIRFSPNSIYFINEQSGWAVCDYGMIIHTSDGGATWIEQSDIQNAVQSTFTGSDFISENTGWVVSNSGSILKTTNGGTDWNKCYSDSAKSFYCVDFISENNGWAGGIENYNGIILRTSDGGKNWETFYSGSDGVISSILFTSDQTGWAVDQNFIINTQDGGKSWVRQYNFPDASSWRVKIFFINKNTGWVIGPGRSIYKTTNEGKDWNTVEVPVVTSIPDCEFFLNDIYFISETTGWIVGSGRMILKTEDGGQTWVQQENSDSWHEDLYSVAFCSLNTGWAVGGTGSIFKTTNGGEIWMKEKTYTPLTLFDINILSENTAWIVGECGVILALDQNTTTSVTESLKGTPGEFVLLQNYPNPFNPSTNFEFRIANSGLVSLKIFNMLGSEVATLINDERPAGEYNIKFDGSRLTSGVYFYQLKAGNFITTKKLMLVK